MAPDDAGADGAEHIESEASQTVRMRGGKLNKKIVVITAFCFGSIISFTAMFTLFSYHTADFPPMLALVFSTTLGVFTAVAVWVQTDSFEQISNDDSPDRRGGMFIASYKCSNCETCFEITNTKRLERKITRLGVVCPICWERRTLHLESDQ